MRTTDDDDAWLMRAAEMWASSAPDQMEFDDRMDEVRKLRERADALGRHPDLVDA